MEDPVSTPGYTQYGDRPPQGTAPYQGATPYPVGIPQPYGGVTTEASKKKIPAAFFFGIATWVAILLIIGVTALMIANSTDESTSAGGVIAIIPMFGTPLVVLPLTVCGLATGASAKKCLMTRKQLIMNRIGFWLSVAPFVIFPLLYALAVIENIVERGV
jgi:hypothetical protein